MPDWQRAGNRRAWAPALCVLAFGLLLNPVIPLINNSIPTDDPVRAGDRIDVGDGMSFAPPVGWQIQAGERAATGSEDAGDPASQTTVQLRGPDGRIQVKGGLFPGDVNALLRRVVANAEAQNGIKPHGDPVTLQTEGGSSGAAQQFATTHGYGLMAAFTFPTGQHGGATGTPIALVFTGVGADSQAVNAIGDAIRSLSAPTQEGEK
jgi:hypothetical protein